jgi:hypothetical protein
MITSWVIEHKFKNIYLYHLNVICNTFSKETWYIENWLSTSPLTPLIVISPIERRTWSHAWGKVDLGVDGKVSSSHGKHTRDVSNKKTIGSTFALKEVSLEITTATYIPPLDKTISMVWYLLVLDVNGLLCIAQHVLSQHKWGPFVHLV